MDVLIPDKLYFKIGEVARLTGIKPHVLRYWEAEFGAFSLAKSRTRQRLYQRRDIELVLAIKALLYEQGFTIAGARRKLRETHSWIALRNDDGARPSEIEAVLRETRDELLRLRASLDQPGVHSDA